MSQIGPTLPPHLAGKRKRGDDEAEDASPPSPRRNSHERPASRPVLGPTLPPAPLDERPDARSLEETKSRADAATGTGTRGRDTGDSDSDDDLGPAPPSAQESTADSAAARARHAEADANAAYDSAEAKAAAAPKIQREEWMLAPPPGSDWGSRIDPTKLKNRKFNTGKTARAGGSGSTADARIWTETPEQKRQRLQDEVMGTGKPDGQAAKAQSSRRETSEERETQRRIQEYNASNRGESLYKQHSKNTPKEKEDDPSARAFDREKDIAGGVKINTTKRRELLNKAADMGSRFSKGSYL